MDTILTWAMFGALTGGLLTVLVCGLLQPEDDESDDE